MTSLSGPLCIDLQTVFIWVCRSVGFDRLLSVVLHLCHEPVEFSPEDDARCKACLLSLLDEWHIDINSVYRQRWQRKKWLRAVKTEEAKHLLLYRTCGASSMGLQPASQCLADPPNASLLTDRHSVRRHCVWLDASYNVCCRNSSR